jgi:hypothetical protein
MTQPCHGDVTISGSKKSRKGIFDGNGDVTTQLLFMAKFSRTVKSAGSPSAGIDRLCCTAATQRDRA